MTLNVKAGDRAHTVKYCPKSKRNNVGTVEHEIKDKFFN